VQQDGAFPTPYLLWCIILLACVLHPLLLIISTIYVYGDEDAPPPSRKLQFGVLASNIFITVMFTIAFNRDDSWPLNLAKETLKNPDRAVIEKCLLMSNAWISFVLAVCAYSVWQHILVWQNAKPLFSLYTSQKKYVSTMSLEYWQTFVLDKRDSMLPSVVLHVSFSLLYYSMNEIKGNWFILGSKHFYYLPYLYSFASNSAFMLIHANLMRVHGHILDTKWGKLFCLICYASIMSTIVVLISARSLCESGKEYCYFDPLHGTKKIYVGRIELDQVLARTFFACFITTVCGFMAGKPWYDEQKAKEVGSVVKEGTIEEQFV
jgi:hypothetical protein